MLEWGSPGSGFNQQCVMSEEICSPRIRVLVMNHYTGCLTKEVCILQSLVESSRKAYLLHLHVSGYYLGNERVVTESLSFLGEGKLQRAGMWWSTGMEVNGVGKPVNQNNVCEAIMCGEGECA